MVLETISGQGGRTLHLHKIFILNLKRKPLANNQIKASKIRLINEKDKQVGIVPFEKALQMAKERNLDLVQVTHKTKPPVCKILDYGKYLYRLEKRDKKSQKSTEIKGIRLKFNISPHDLKTRLDQAEEFLKEGDKIKIEMPLRGREHRLTNFAKNKIEEFLKDLNERLPIKTEGELKKKGRGFNIIVSRTS